MNKAVYIPKVLTRSKIGGQIIRGVTPELAKIIGTNNSTFRNALSQVWTYIVDNKLQDPHDKLLVRANSDLKAVFPGEDILSAAKILGGINVHLKDAVAQEPFKPYKTAKTKHLPQNTGSQKLRADGQPDMRFAINKVKTPKAIPVYYISEKFQTFLREGKVLKDPLQPIESMTVGQAIKLIWVYVRLKKLQIPNPGTNFHVDAAISQLFDLPSTTLTLHFLDLNSLIRSHVNGVVPREKVKIVRPQKLRPVPLHFQVIMDNRYEIDRYEAMKLFYKYMYAHGLQDKGDKQLWILNDELRNAINDPQYSVSIRNPDVMKIIHKLLYQRAEVDIYSIDSDTCAVNVKTDAVKSI